MPEKGLFLNFDFYPWTKLKNYQGDVSVLQFCRDWLLGMDAFMRYSSGSTGTPKAISIHRKQMLASVAATAKILKPSSTDQILLNLNPDTIGGTMSLVRAMEWGLNIHVFPADGNPMIPLDHIHPFTLCSLVPLQLHDILKDPESIAKLNQFRVVLLGGAAIDHALFAAIQELRPIVYHTYGMTETCSHIALRQLNGEEKQERFHPLEGVSLRLAEDRTLLIDAPMAIHTSLKTNDLARIYSDQSFEIIGRLDRTLISGGVKMQLDELEALFSPLFPDLSFFLYGLEDARLGQKMVLVLESEPFSTPELEKKLKELAPAYKAPKAIIFAPRFERTLTGKTDRINTIRKWAKTN
ncbi:MAG TPA: O-succinylbenzoic acid--CoA ligase [Bacteroidetes bacterium]|nr:O-succinylbenzoic acid--CoA ligase [Bacteroidota bacterium]